MLDINSIKKRFLALNRERLSRTRETLRPRQRDVMDLLPLLFHINHPSFPGFVSSDTPVGISEYSPTKRSTDAGKKLVHGFSFSNRALPKYDLYALFLMGSCGSIAYNSNSDFDIWLCHRPDLDANGIDLLQKKATAIEEWTAEYNLEVHFFLMNADDFREGANVALSSESSGSAQHYLLLEEFYRTSLLYAGRFPIWWLVPPSEETNYTKYTRDLINRRFVRDGEIIDFGGMPTGLEQEFFGAALWQLYKSVDSPYKAVLKLMLMETYASEFPNTELLCMRFKQAVHDGEKNVENLDPYIMLYDKISSRLQQQDDQERRALVQRSFYFKVGQKLGEIDSVSNDSWQRDAMKSLTKSWGWDEGYMSLLDMRHSWKIDRVLEERKTLVDTLTQSYHFLSNFARDNNTLSDINQKDLHILGRKLYAAFERKSGKIEIVNRGISNEIWESHMSFHQIGKGKASSWSLFQGIIYADDVNESKPLKRSRSIVELIVWCFLNNLIDQRTVIALYAQDSTVTLNDIKAITRGLNHLFPNGKPIAIKMDDLIQAPRLTTSNIFINIGMEPSKSRLTQGMCLTSDHVDALSYGGVGENLILSFDHVLQNSWQEIMSYRYEGEKGLLDCLGAYMQWAPPSKGTPPPTIKCLCFTTGRGTAIAKRIEDLFKSVVACFYNKKLPDTTRYILRMGHTYFALTMEQDVFNHKRIGNHNYLLRYLAEPNHSFSPVVFEREAIPNPLLPVIYRNNKADTIQLFFHQKKDHIEAYILDEKGSMIFQRLQNANENIMLNQYQRFFSAITHKQDMQLAGINDSQAEQHINRIEYFQIIRDGRGQQRLLPRTIDNNQQSLNYFHIQVVVDSINEGKMSFTLYCDNREFSSLEFGDKVFHEVALHVMAQRKSGLAYPIYITDIEISRPLLSKEPADKLQTIYFLTYKRSIEDKLNNALAQLGRSKSAHG